MYKHRFYFKLSDLIKIQSTDYTDEPFFAKDGTHSIIGLVNLLSGKTFTIDNDDKYLFQEIIYPQYYNNYVALHEYTSDQFYMEQPHFYDLDNSLYMQMAKLFYGRLYSWYKETKEVYIPLITFYKDEAANLMNKISTISTAKFNDTPQDAGDFDDDDHTSTISRNETQSDGMTLISRLNEVREKLTNIYGEWADNFASRFVIFRGDINE